jgi:hypothetical protein
MNFVVKSKLRIEHSRSILNVAASPQRNNARRSVRSTLGLQA